MNDLFEFLGFQDAMRKSESNQNMSEITNDFIMNGNYSNTADLVSDLVNIRLEGEN